MERQPWLERAAAELARRRVPAGYRARLLAELADHIHDLTEEGVMTTDERLGDPEAVAATAAARLRCGWVRRHPVLVFGLAPVPMAFGVMLALLIGLGLVVWAADELTGWLTLPATRPLAGRALIAAFDLTVRFGAAVATVAAFVRLAARAGIDRRWLAVAAVQLAAFAGCWATFSRYSDAPNQSALSFTFLPLAWWDGFVGSVGWVNVAQAVAPVAVGAVLFARFRRGAGPVAAV